MPRLDASHAREIDRFLDNGRSVATCFRQVIANDGDGDAYQVTVSGDGVLDAVLFMRDPDNPSEPMPWRSYPRITPGESVFAFWWHDDPKATTGEGVTLSVSWCKSPIRNGRNPKVTRIALH